MSMEVFETVVGAVLSMMATLVVITWWEGQQTRKELDSMIETIERQIRHEEAERKRVDNMVSEKNFEMYKRIEKALNNLSKREE